MRKIVFTILLLTLSLFAMAKKQHSSNGTGVDDWDYNTTVENIKAGKKGGRVMPMTTMASAPMMKKSLGFSTGGAKDADNFYENIKNGYLPKLKSITYEGVFYDHYFKSPDSDECKSLFCPTYTTYSQENLFTKEIEHFISVGLDSNIDAKDFKRKKLNIVVVLDISGSMGSPFNSYYYDKRGTDTQKKDSKLSKMEIANRALVGMIDHLSDEDRLGIVLFDNNSYNAKPLRVVKETDMDAIKRHILDLKSRGGTNWSAGYRSGLALFERLKSEFKDPNIYENRIIFLTDAMPNRGELREDGLFGMVDTASKSGIYTTFIGIGIDFNNDLVESVSKTKGANYFSVHSNDEFMKRMDEEFDYMVTPLVFDLKLRLINGKNRIEAVYGSPEADRATGEIMYVNTLFPSPTKDGKTKGGVILLKVKEPKNMTLEVSYKDRAAKSFKSQKDIKFKNSSEPSIQKAILLSNYVTLMKNWIMDMRASCSDKVDRSKIIPLREKCMIYPPDREIYPMIESWERRSCPLRVSDGYKKLLTLFFIDFEEKIRNFPDDDFDKELGALKTLISFKKSQKSGVIDDWNSKR